jgi:hypothetical protein
MFDHCEKKIKLKQKLQRYRYQMEKKYISTSGNVLTYITGKSVTNKTYTRGADKSLDRPRRKQATATKPAEMSNTPL